MIEAQIFNDQSVELLAGEIVEMSPESPLHYNTAKRGVRYLEDLLQDKAEVRFNGAITLADSEPEPDIAIARLPESRYDKHHPYPEDHGIEIDSDLAERARDLVDEHAPDASIHFGSYFPNGFDAVEDDDEFLSVLPGPAAYDDVGHEVRDFDVVYVFPWPGTESMHLELFDRTASPGAILVSHQGLEGTHVLRKTDGVPSLDDFA